MLNFVCVDTGEQYETVTCVFTKARKTHVCGECREPILPGQHYEYFVGKGDIGVETHKTCATCLRIRAGVMGCGCVPGFMWAEIHQANCLEADDGFCFCPPKADLRHYDDD